jgi:hypothetical protein
MACWRVERRESGREGLRLYYKNLITGAEYHLGSISTDWSDVSVLDWVFQHAENVTAGDWILPSDGTLLQYARWRGEA